ncbi:MAG: tetratricopeptide repeat protein [Flavobacteriales bacterium]|nr:tetratricopeptide repeat protein [Flavobacteriales bacterium]
MRRSIPMACGLLFSVALFAQGEAWREVQELYAKNKVYAGIRKCDKQLSGRTPDRAFLVLRAEGLNRIGENEKAQRDARTAYAELSGDLRHAAALQRGIAAAAMGVPDSARYWFEAARGAADDSDALFRTAMMDKVNGDHATARALLDTVLSKHPQRTDALIERAACSALLGDSASARSDIERALEIAPRDPVIWNSRGFYVHAYNGRYAQAIADYDQAIKFDPNYSYAFNNRGWAYYKLGDTEKAVKNITLAGRKKKANPYVYRNLGIIALESGDKERACAHFRTALALRFTELQGPEVQELMDANCAKSSDKPQQNDPPGRNTRPNNAPGRNNAP